MSADGFLVQLLGDPRERLVEEIVEALELFPRQVRGVESGYGAELDGARQTLEQRGAIEMKVRKCRSGDLARAKADCSDEQDQHENANGGEQRKDEFFDHRESVCSRVVAIRRRSRNRASGLLRRVACRAGAKKEFSLPGEMTNALLAG